MFSEDLSTPMSEESSLLSQSSSTQQQYHSTTAPDVVIDVLPSGYTAPSTFDVQCTVLSVGCALVFAIAFVVFFVWIRATELAHIDGTPSQRCAKAKQEHDDWLIGMLVCRCLELMFAFLWLFVGGCADKTSCITKSGAHAYNKQASSAASCTRPSLPMCLRVFSMMDVSVFALCCIAEFCYRVYHLSGIAFADPHLVIALNVVSLVTLLSLCIVVAVQLTTLRERTNWQMVASALLSVVLVVDLALVSTAIGGLDQTSLCTQATTASPNLTSAPVGVTLEKYELLSDTSACWILVRSLIAVWAFGGTRNALRDNAATTFYWWWLVALVVGTSVGFVLWIHDVRALMQIVCDALTLIAVVIVAVSYVNTRHCACLVCFGLWLSPHRAIGGHQDLHTESAAPLALMCLGPLASIVAVTTLWPYYADLDHVSLVSGAFVVVVQCLLLPFIPRAYLNDWHTRVFALLSLLNVVMVVSDAHFVLHLSTPTFSALAALVAVVGVVLVRVSLVVFWYTRAFV